MASRTAAIGLPVAGLIDSTRGPEVYINPVLSAPTGVPEPGEEGCLSLPEINGDVLRPPIITITATGLDGKAFTRTGAGLLARCWQHETDHLGGTVFGDRLSKRVRAQLVRDHADVADRYSARWPADQR